MKSTHDCIPCFMRQALDAARFAVSDNHTVERVLRSVAHALGDLDLDQSPPAMARDIYRIIRDVSGCKDPYKAVKSQFNTLALSLYPGLKHEMEHTADPFEYAVRAAISGNIIDFGALSGIDGDLVGKTLEKDLAVTLKGDVRAFKHLASKSENILYLGDNAGEIVFDRLLIEQLPQGRVTFAVRGYPIINDATFDDAEETGLTGRVPVISNGSDAPGTLLEDCSGEFRDVFEQADLIIAKGQGNYESLSESSKNIIFLLKAKCGVIAEHLGCSIGDAIIGPGRKTAG